MPIKIIQGEAVHIAALDRLLKDSYPRLLAADYPASILSAVLPHITKAQLELVTSGTYFVALHGGALVGGGGWTRDVPGSTGTQMQGVGHIRHFAIDANRVRMGIASALMARVLQSAAAQGVQRIDCLSTRTAVPFYQRMGFERDVEVDVPLGGRVLFPALAMTRKGAA